MSMSDSKGNDVLHSEISYFSPEKKFLVEKPYTTTFPVDDIPGAEVSNHEWVPKPVSFQNLRCLQVPDFERQGFTYATMPTSLQHYEFYSKETVRSTYFKEIVELLSTIFPAYRSIAIFDHEVRKRSLQYPHSKGTVVDNAQPYRHAHVDFTPVGARLKLSGALGDDAEARLRGDFDVLNVWRLIGQPTDDWPLAFCDHSSIDATTDTIANDVVYRSGTGENAYLRPNENHRWFYLKDQSLDEVWIWRNTDAEGKRSCAYHAAFPNPHAEPSSPLRESIEVRLAAFY